MKKLFLLLFPFALQAQPLTLNDPAMLDWPKQFVGGCTVSNCPVEFWSVLTNWWQHTCGTVAGDEFTGYYGGNNRPGAEAGMGWNFHTYNASLGNNPGFFGEGFNLCPYICYDLGRPTVTTLSLTNVQAAAVYLVCSNFAAVEPAGIVQVRRNAPPFDDAEEGTFSQNPWYAQPSNLPNTNSYTQADLTAGAVIGWTGGAGFTNLQVIANKGGSVYAEFHYTGEREYHQYQWIWWLDDFELVSDSPGTQNTSLIYSMNGETNWSEVTIEPTGDGGNSGLGGSPGLPMDFNWECWEGFATLDCGQIGFNGTITPCAMRQWQLLSGDISGLEGRWNSLATNGWYLTNYVQLYDTHSLTNYLAGGTGGWVTNWYGTNDFTAVRMRWNISLIIANSYLYFDYARFATNSLCQ